VTTTETTERDYANDYRVTVIRTETILYDLSADDAAGAEAAALGAAQGEPPPPTGEVWDADTIEGPTFEVGIVERFVEAER